MREPYDEPGGNWHTFGKMQYAEAKYSCPDVIVYVSTFKMIYQSIKKTLTNINL